MAAPPKNVCATFHKTSGNQPWTKPLYDEATCGNVLSAVLNFHPAPSKYLPTVSSLREPWFHHRICSLGLAAQQRNSLEAAIEPNVCIMETERSGLLRKLDLFRAALSWWCFFLLWVKTRLKVILPSSIGPLAVNRVNAYLPKNRCYILSIIDMQR